MSYQTPITIKKALERIDRGEYVLPAIQREFVWEQEQICRLFDSLLRGYPIGTFLFWKVESQTAGTFQFYEFMRDYHEAKRAHSEKVHLLEAKPLTAVLDGQQRLTSLNIGIRGTYAVKAPGKRVTAVDAYPVRRLHMDLLFEPSDEDDIEFRFQFLTEAEAGRSDTWYLVADVLDLPNAGPAIFEVIRQRGLEGNDVAFPALAKLHEAILDRAVINFFEEEEQSLGKVLDIFVRVNSGGTVLSKSDLLLSVATAQFTARDAREAVHTLVDDINAVGHGFKFSKDVVLKTGLMLAVDDPGFKLGNFTRTNMAALDREWDRIARSLQLAARLLSSFGLSERTMSANSLIIPIADYIYQRRLDQPWLTTLAAEPDRQSIRRWIIKTLIKPGVWGSGLDTMLKTLHTVMVGTDGTFPVDRIEAEMARLGKSLVIDDALLEELVDTPYKNKRVYALLSLLYPAVDTRHDFHEDHIFPKSLFTRGKLVKAGLTPNDVEAAIERYDRLPNLQLLEGSTNVQKRAMLPRVWLAARFPDEVSASAWLAAHDMHDLPDNLNSFVSFYEERRQRLLFRLRDLLTPPPAA